MKNILFVDEKVLFFSRLGKMCEHNGCRAFFLVSTLERKKILLKNGCSPDRIHCLPEEMGRFSSENTFEISKEDIDSAMAFMVSYSGFKPSFYDKKYYSGMYRILNLLHGMIKAHDIHLAVLWNYVLFPLPIVKLYCRKNNVPVCFFECGYFRPDTLTFDTKGLNFENSVPRSPLFFLQDYTPGKREKPDLPVQKIPDFKLKKPSFFFSSIYKTAFWLKSLFLYPYRLCRFTRSAGKGLVENLRKWQIHTFTKDTPFACRDIRYFLVPFQVHKDTQILTFSSAIRSMHDLVDTVISAVSRLKENGELKDISIVFKEHPEDQGMISYSELYKKYEHISWVYFLRRYDTQELIEHAEAVITINSTVAIEALAKHKKVLTLGDAFFNIEGLVIHHTGTENLDDDIQKLQEFVPDTKLADLFIDYLRNTYNIPGNWHRPTPENLVPATRKLLEILEHEK